MKRQDEELWMKKMKESLKDYSEPPAPDGWNRLEKELSPVVEKKIRPYTWWAVAATVLLAVIGASMFFMQTPTADDIRHISTPKLTVTPDIIPEPDKMPETVKPENKPMAQDISSVSRSTTSRGRLPETKKTDDVVTVVEKEGDKLAYNDKPVVTDNRGQPSKDEPKESDKVEHRTDKNSTDQSTSQPDDRRTVRRSGKDKLHLPVASAKEQSSRGKWSVAASVSNAAGTTVSETQDYMSMANWYSPSASASSNSLANGMIAIKDNDQLVFDGGIPYLKQSAEIGEIKHKQPISFGLSVRRNLSNGFSVESGVTYTMLSSEGKSTVNSSQKIEQKLHYIGIPLRANWDFVQSKRFNVYLTAGGMIEKCVYGKIGTEKHTVKPLQFSLAGGVGGQFNISNRIGLYVEPGVSYFFDDGSDVETIRKENKLNFNLQAGIRFTY